MKLDWNVGLVAHLGIEFVEVGADRVVARLTVTDKLLTTTGVVHGGTLMAFADTIGAAGTVANLAEGQRTATLESKTNFIAGCKSGVIQAVATPIHKGRRTQVWETRITDEAGKLLSVTTQTQMIL
jgi:uncharacterized protein (TIGR00369 family)